MPYYPLSPAPMSTMSMPYDSVAILDALIKKFMTPNPPRTPVSFAGPFSRCALEQEPKDEVEDVPDSYYNTPPPVPGFKPRLDVYVDPNTNIATVMLELPGMDRRHITIEIIDGKLIVAGERVPKEGWNDNGYAVRERGWGKFKRTVSLPKRIKIEEVKARFEDGLLIITFPNAAPEEAPSKINIDF